MLVRLTVCVPVFVSVASFGSVAPPAISWFPYVRLVGERVSSVCCASPFSVTEMSGAFDWTVAVAVFMPVVAGSKVNLRSQVLPMSTFAPGLQSFGWSVSCVKSAGSAPVMSTPEIETGSLPVLVTVEV